MASAGVIVVLALMAASCVATVRASGSWNYDESSGRGPGNWYRTWPTCGSNSQSPVNIETSKVKHMMTSFLSLDGYNTPPADEFTLTNNGQSAVVEVNTKTITVKAGGLPGTYILEQLQFHWGADDTRGSEHTVNNASHPLEIHLVHYSNKYTSVSEAVNSNDKTGAAVIGVFGDVNNDANKEAKGFGKILNKLSEIFYNGNSTTCESFELSSMLPPSNLLSMFFRYNGSLTTPGCQEVVIWNVFADPIYITSAHLAEFRKMKNSDDAPLDRNHRPIQPLNTRTVYHMMASACSQLQMSLVVALLNVFVVYVLSDSLVSSASTSV